MEIWIKGKPLPEGCEDFGIVGIVDNPVTGEIHCTFDDDLPDDVREKIKTMREGEFYRRGE